jgi:acyl dehydratase
MLAYPHERFAVEVTLTPAMVATYAAAAGDTNPVHHAPTFAATTLRSWTLLHVPPAALLLGLTASHYSQHGAMVGLEFWVRLRHPIYADETIRLEWLVVRVTPNARLKGDIVELRGRILGHNGVTALGAKGRMLVTVQL